MRSFPLRAGLLGDGVVFSLADEVEVASRERLQQLLGDLCSLVEQEGAATIVLARSSPDNPIEVRTPPPGFAVTTRDVATKIVSVMARSLVDDNDAVGVAFPAARRGFRIDSTEVGRADGWAVCVAGRTTSGVRSAGLYWPLVGTGWEEANSGLDWFCERLSLLILEEPVLSPC